MIGLSGGAAAITGPEVDVSQLTGPQTNPTITVDPRDDRILLAGSNSLLEGAERVYSSTDGGATWSTSTLTPPVANLRSTCPSDPGVAIDRTGRQYYSFDRSTPCTSDAPSRVYVASRQGPDAAWSNPVLVAPLGRARFDDKPAIAVDAAPASPHVNRIYVVWSHVSRRVVSSIVISHSDDQGRTWSRAAKVSRGGDDLIYANVATARNGTVYVTWTDSARYTVWIARSTDGGEHFGPGQRAAAFTVVTDPALRHRDRHPRRPAHLHPGQPDRLGRHLGRPLHRPRLCQLHGHGLHRRPGRGALDLRQPAAADRGLPGARAPSRRLAGAGSQGVRPVLAAVGRRPLGRLGLALLLRHARRPDACEGVLLVRRLAERRQDLDPAGAGRVGPFRRDPARRAPVRLLPGARRRERRRPSDVDRHAPARRAGRGDLHGSRDAGRSGSERPEEWP